MKKIKVKLLLTFDYEIFFGENYGDDLYVLFEPMQKIAAGISKNIKLVLFVDIGFMQVLFKEKKEMFEIFLKQLNDLKLSGHELQFHYHPHWYDSGWDETEKKWIFDHTNFSYASQVKNLGLAKANEIFDEAISFFKKYFGSTNCYRAGGLMLQPFEKELIQQLVKNGFEYDASVLPNAVLTSPELNYDFKDHPLSYKWPVYSDSFNRSVGNKTTLSEVPSLFVMRNEITLADKIKGKVRRILSGNKKYAQSVRRGKSIYNGSFKIETPFTISFDYANKAQVDYFIMLADKYITKTGRQDVIVSVLSHPKCIDENAINAMNDFIDKMKVRYDLSVVGFNDLK